MSAATKRQVAFDMLLNVVATALPLVVLQVIVLPLMAYNMEGGEYGLVVTILSAFSVIPGVLGNTLNNIRLIYDKKYKDCSLSGDFNPMVLASSTVSFLAIIATAGFMGVVDIVSLIMLGVASAIWLVREYYIVAFRIELNYKAILISNVIQALGYFLGYGLFLFTREWVLVYAVGQILGLAYVFRKSDLHKEPLRITPLLKPTLKDTASLVVSNFLSKVMVYSDRIVLHPLIGGNAVAVYYVSTLVGKILSMAVSPVNGVMLSYLAKRKSKTTKTFAMTMATGLALCVIVYCAIALCGRSVLGFLYPMYVDAAMEYISITSATALVYVLISMALPFTLKFFAMKWQIAVNATTCVIYLGLGLGLYDLFGLMGFCIGALVANVLKLALLVGLFCLMNPDSSSL